MITKKTKHIKALIITQHNINNARITIIHICHLFNNITIYKIIFCKQAKDNCLSSYIT